MSIPTDTKQIYLAHQNSIAKGFMSLDMKELEAAIELIDFTTKIEKKVYTCGNGASAAIAEHMACDFTKGCFNEKYGQFYPQVVSLSSNLPLISAIANDISYDDVYSFQLNKVADPEDVLVVISSSGNSPNVVKAIEEAHAIGMTVVALTGFTGGKARELADIKLHVEVDEYEATEDCHQAIMQVIAKVLRRRNWK